MISAVILASGRTDRTGEQESLVPLRDKPVLQWGLESALASDLHEIFAWSATWSPYSGRSPWCISEYIGLSNSGTDRVRAVRSSQDSGPSIRRVTECYFFPAVNR